MKGILFSLLVLCNISLQADVAGGVLECYPNRVFLVTGVSNYVTISRAVNAGFSEIYGIGDNKVIMDHTKYIIPVEHKGFESYNAVLGDSKTDLLDIMNQINEPATIFLGSYIPDVDDLNKSNKVLEELEQIKCHPINNHTILVEYIQHAGTSLFGNITLAAIKSKLLKINPSYKFTLKKGGHLERENDAVLVAYLEDKFQ